MTIREVLGIQLPGIPNNRRWARRRILQRARYPASRVGDNLSPLFGDTYRGPLRGESGAEDGPQISGQMAAKWPCGPTVWRMGAHLACVGALQLSPRNLNSAERAIHSGARRAPL